jgi:hypothetical protein
MSLPWGVKYRRKSLHTYMHGFFLPAHRQATWRRRASSIAAATARKAYVWTEWLLSTRELMNTIIAAAIISVTAWTRLAQFNRRKKQHAVINPCSSSRSFSLHLQCLRIRTIHCLMEIGVTVQEWQAGTEVRVHNCNVYSMLIDELYNKYCMIHVPCHFIFIGLKACIVRDTNVKKNCINAAICWRHAADTLSYLLLTCIPLVFPPACRIDNRFNERLIKQRTASDTLHSGSEERLKAIDHSVPHPYKGHLYVGLTRSGLYLNSLRSYRSLYKFAVYFKWQLIQASCHKKEKPVRMRSAMHSACAC